MATLQNLTDAVSALQTDLSAQLDRIGGEIADLKAKLAAGTLAEADLDPVLASIQEAQSALSAKAQGL